MEKLSETAERVWKVLSQFPHGKARYKELMRITSLRKSRLYKVLDELKRKGFVEHEKPFWILKMKNETSKTSLENIEPRIEAYADAEWLTKQWKAFEPLDELFKIERRIRKELGGSQ
jgi:sugar-specific transcriptional regulator TrmB